MSHLPLREENVGGQVVTAPGPNLRIATHGQEPPYEVSKWLRVQLLCDEREMSALMDALGSFFIFAVSGVLRRDDVLITKEQFLEGYGAYVSALRLGTLPSEGLLKKVAPTVWTAHADALYALAVNEQELLVRISQPVIQVQHHRFDYSPFDGKFRSMVLGSETVMWGLQFAYPQLYKDPKTREVIMLNDPAAFPNTALFRQLQRWVRDHTIATPFVVNGVQTNVPIRTGKQCMSWINQHPQLRDKGISVKSNA